MNRQSNNARRSGSLLLFSILALVSAGTCKRETPAQANMANAPAAEVRSEPARSVLRSSLAGTWYSDDPNALRQQLDGFFQKADVKPTENVVALILPHAGYTWSGQTAAFGLKTTEKQYKRVVVIGPSHRTDMEEIVSVPQATHYETPLGQIPLDTEFMNRLLKFPMVQNVPAAHQGENSIEIQVPITQYRQGDFKLVPIVAGQCSFETIERIGAALRSLVDGDTLVIASSDFVHYGPNYGYVPFDKDVPGQLKKLDMGAYERIAALDAKGFMEYTQKTGATICGRIPIAILLSMLGKTAEAHLAQYATSGELTGDFTNSVSYLAVVFTGQWQAQRQSEPQPNAAELTEQDKKQLLTLARKTMVYALQNRRVPEAADLDVTISAAMQRPRAAFVTLTKDSMLRGCIGDIFPQRPLYKSVIINAIHACVNDRRFPPVSEDELRDIHIEISALTLPSPIASPDQIRIGIDGVILNKEGHSAVFLPQVAPEQGWNVEQMLTHLSLKAGLGPDDWRDGASFEAFQAQVF